MASQGPLHEAVDRILDGDDDDLKVSTVFLLLQREAEAVDRENRAPPTSGVSEKPKRTSDVWNATNKGKVKVIFHVR